jgi:hypothetical protein
MPRVVFEPTITASEQAKTVHASDRSATVTGKVTPYAATNNRILLAKLLYQRYI